VFAIILSYAGATAGFGPARYPASSTLHPTCINKKLIKICIPKGVLKRQTQVFSDFFLLGVAALARDSLRGLTMAGA
jgi:hypothetical protein